MHVEWSGLGPELLVTLDRSSSTGLRVQLERQLRTAIRDGRLAPSERLPSSRELAAALGLSRGLVQECYAQLTAEGYLETRTGSATRVKGAGPGAPVSTWLPRVPVQLPPPSIADFRSGVPDLGLAPRADWAWAVREACRTMPDEALGYGDSAGDLHLRGVLAAYLGRVRAALCTADQVALSTGMAQALSLVMQVFADLGYTTIAYEDPGPVLSTPRRADVTD
jgi:GntR family transcriptional regulator/MocR family aminotransferase